MVLVRAGELVADVVVRGVRLVEAVEPAVGVSVVGLALGLAVAGSLQHRVGNIASSG